MMKRSILGLMYLIQGMRHLGIPVDQRLKSIGLQSVSFDAGAVIHPELEMNIYQVLAYDLEPELGLEVGQHYALAGYGPLLMLLLTSPNVKEALKNAIHYQALTHLSGELGFEIHKKNVALIYNYSKKNHQIEQFKMHCEISGTYKFLQDIYKMVGLDFPQIRIELPFSKPKEHARLEQFNQYYGPAVFYDAEVAKFIFDANVMHIDIPSSDAITCRLYEAKCDAELERMRIETQDEHRLIERVQDFLEMQKGYFPTMAETAYALQLPERTLRHQLQQKQTSYMEIREKLIRRKALVLMDDHNLSIEQIAERLGYSEPAAFNHAFKRWFGQSPRQFRK